MKVHCPCCSAIILAANINLDTGWGKCDQCQELFPLSTAVPELRPERPFNARATVEKTAETLFVDVPPEGMRADTFGVLAFATVWLGFIGFWTLGALGGFGGQPMGPVNWTFALFSVPFWLAGIAMMGMVAWKIWGRNSIRLDAHGLSTHRQCLAWSRSKWIELDRVQHAQHFTPRVISQGQRPFAVEIVYRVGSFVLPADSEEEEAWLICEINEFVKAMAA